MLEGQRIKVTILRSASSSGKLFCGQMKQNLQTWTVILWDQRKQGEKGWCVPNFSRSRVKISSTLASRYREEVRKEVE